MSTALLRADCVAALACLHEGRYADMTRLWAEAGDPVALGIVMTGLFEMAMIRCHEAGEYIDTMAGRAAEEEASTLW